MPSNNRTLFLALRPDPSFAEKLLSYKKRVHALVGNQLYLDHPPHLTVYLSIFPRTVNIEDETRRLATGLSTSKLSLAGWRVFAPDPMNGNNTLVCSLQEADCERLRKLQGRIVEHISPLRDAAAARSRFEPNQRRLSALEWNNVLSCGFPYTGSIWQPHFTVASILPSQWPPVWNALQSAAPTGTVSCPELVLYELSGSGMQERATFPLH